jgi:hypothetical protein
LSVQPTKTIVRPSRDQEGKSSSPLSSPLTSRLGAAPVIGLIHSLPRLSKTTWRPSGETLAQRGIRVWKRSGATSICGCKASITTRVSLTRNGISAPPPPSAPTRRILPPAQKTTDRLSGVHAMLG